MFGGQFLASVMLLWVPQLKCGFELFFVFPLFVCREQQLARTHLALWSVHVVATYMLVNSLPTLIPSLPLPSPPPPPPSTPAVNYLIIESLERFHFFYGDDLKVNCPTKGGPEMNLRQVSQELCRRMALLFEPDAQGNRPCHGGSRRYAEDPHWKNLLLFHEYFHGDTGRGCGARCVLFCSLTLIGSGRCYWKGGGVCSN